MKKLTMLALVATLVSVPVFAQNSASTGGFSGPGTTETTSTQQSSGFSGPNAGTMTVEKALTMSDDTWISLQGNIEQQIGKELYVFRDKTGTINVDIDHKRWDGLTITPTDTVELQGEIDKGWNSVELDVKQIKKIK
ncbi:YgiW/YdeI family stress tolerance OB fold protein [Jinshanibacter sp. LJY008]|uniref:YgiW/YdeI family stress tolerance OB fold protein n=1 Tax=Limnobaculum eriocheiris TaxID=2897391 RepID=A0A9X1MZ35_9GAMM|nr:YgiW/YdeI family stress tolerance OB fold protein [Limnobaculum eriocheiris]MCD1126870.1 YgiW/YdeI family stress tolerance OB fold protein [Limnobaculum eriocheiris]